MTHRRLPESPDALSELQRLLANAPGAMSLPEALGFLTALASAPSPPEPREWLPELFGPEVLASEGRMKHALALADHLQTAILAGLRTGRVICPHAPDPDDDVASWCTGYLRAAHSDPEWMSDLGTVDMLLPFSVLAGQFDLVGEEDAEGNVIETPTKWIQEYRRGLPGFVAVFSAYWERGR